MSPQRSEKEFLDPSRLKRRVWLMTIALYAFWSLETQLNIERTYFIPLKMGDYVQNSL